MCSFFKCSVILCFFLKYLPHFWQCNALNVFSTWIITYIKLGVSHLWKNFQDEIVHQRTFTKKAPNFFWLLVEDIKIPYTLYKIQNFQGTPWASIIATCLIKLLRTGPFQTHRSASTRGATLLHFGHCPLRLRLGQFSWDFLILLPLTPPYGG